MYKVSNLYKKSMKDSLRNRSFMMISFGLINQEAQAHAKIEGSDFAYFSHQSDMFGQRTDDVLGRTGGGDLAAGQARAGDHGEHRSQLEQGLCQVRIGL